MGTDGLAAFLELARLDEKLPEAADFCNQIGAIEVREVLEDEELCQELAGHLQLKPLELKRFQSLASEVSADPSFQLIDPEPKEAQWSQPKEAAPPVREPREPDEAFAPRSRPLFASNSWAKPSRGKGRGTSGTGHYFDQGKTGNNSTVSKHYWSAVEEESAPRVSANPYFGSLASEGICACGSSNVGRHMCFDCGRERQATQKESQVESRQGDGHNSKAVNQTKQANQGRRFCIHCGAPQVAAAKFCSECGERCMHGAESPPEASGSFQRRGGYFEKVPGQHEQHGTGASKPEDEVDSFQDYKAQLRKEVLNGPATERGVGAYIRSLEGDLWGRVVCDQGRSWQLASGRSAKKENEGKVWVFENPNAIKAPKVVPEVTRQSSILDDLAEKRRQEEEALQAKREAARRRRREGDAAQTRSERRVDPDDNQLYTWEELRARYRGMFSDSEVLDYWNKDCTVVPAGPAGRPKQGHSGHGGHGGHGNERRKDPDDGKIYSFDELCRKYRGAFSLEEIEEYWLEECRS